MEEIPRASFRSVGCQDALASARRGTAALPKVGRRVTKSDVIVRWLFGSKFHTRAHTAMANDSTGYLSVLGFGLRRAKMRCPTEARKRDSILLIMLDHLEGTAGFRAATVRSLKVALSSVVFATIPRWCSTQVFVRLTRAQQKFVSGWGVEFKRKAGWNLRT